MSERRWLKFDPRAWVADTLILESIEIGVYVQLLAYMHIQGGAISENTHRLHQICGASKRRFQSILTKLIARNMITTADGFLWHESRALALPDAVREPIDRATRNYIFGRDEYTCQYCGDTEGPFHIDHIHPVSRGGTNHYKNLTTACAPCNMSKGFKTLQEWVQ